MSQPARGRNADGRPRRRRPRKVENPPPRLEAPAPRRIGEPAVKICRKCGGRMHPADWIWQKYGLCVGWRCSSCKEKVMARSLPFKGLRKRPLDPDEIRPAAPPGAGAADAPKQE